VRYLPKWLWAVVICVAVPWGGLLYLIFGKARPAASMPGKVPTAEEAGIAASGPPLAGRVPVSPVVIEVDQLTKRFGPVTAVDGLSFTVRPGHVTGFLGPNGAGKTTTMRVILGLDAPTSGRALVGGRRYQEIIRPLHVAITVIYLLAVLCLVLPSPWNIRLGRFTLPFAAYQLVTLHPQPGLLSPGLSMLVLIGWPAAVLLAATLVITRRDA
jgi:hypothetical protein